MWLRWYVENAKFYITIMWKLKGTNGATKKSQKLVHQPNFEIIEKKRQKTPTFYGCQASVLDLS